ncbi:MAG: DNA glycosylase AlkZ-like family protein [Mycobacteriales bacterium]
MQVIDRAQAIRYRLHVNHLTARLPAGAYDVAARCGLQDSWPRSGLISLAARVESCRADAWEDPRLVQTYSPRAAVHLLPADDLGVFTIGRLPADPAARRVIEDDAERICRALGGRARRTADLPPELRDGLRGATATGRIVIRWDARSLRIREHPQPAMDAREAAIELARRHLHHYGPTTPALFARWSGQSPADARGVWRHLAVELAPVSVEGSQAWILAADEECLGTAPAHIGVRLLPAEEMRLLEFAGTGQVRPPLADTFHPHGLLVDGVLAGAWAAAAGGSPSACPAPRRCRHSTRRSRRYRFRDAVHPWRSPKARRSGEVVAERPRRSQRPHRSLEVGDVVDDVADADGCHLGHPTSRACSTRGGSAKYDPIAARQRV